MKIEEDNIYLGDSYKLIKEIPSKSVDLIYTDIPYLIDDGGCSDNDLSRRAQRLRNVDLADIRKGIDYSIFDEFCRVLKNIYIYIWCNKNQMLDIMNYFVKEKGCYMEVLCWCKTNPTPLTNNVWLPDIEYCLMFREKNCFLYGSYETKSKFYLSSINKQDKDDYKHPTIKPLEFVKKHIINSTLPNQIVLDAFAGSGTTCVAAKQLGRHYIGFEINEKYYNIAKDRLNGVNQKGEMNLFETDFDKEQENYEQLKLFDV